MISFTESGGANSIYQLKVTLKHSAPPIWRRILIRSNLKLDRLHPILQIVMGWSNCHLHQYHVRAGFKQTTYGVPEPDYESFGCQMHDERRFTVSDLLTAPKRKIFYEYDFGDSWIHDLLLEKILPPDPEFKHPICLAGANACPPEDSGGIAGFQGHFLKALSDPQHEEHESMKEWIGGSWDPAHFDLAAVNNRLRRLKG